MVYFMLGYVSEGLMSAQQGLEIEGKLLGKYIFICYLSYLSKVKSYDNYFVLEIIYCKEKKLCFFRTKSILFNFKTDLKSKLLKTNEGKCEICKAEKSCVYNIKHKDRNG